MNFLFIICLVNGLRRKDSIKYLIHKLLDVFFESEENRLENLRIYSANVNFNTPFNYLQRQKRRPATCVNKFWRKQKPVKW